MSYASPSLDPLQDAATHLRRIFRLHAPEAPGIFIVGAEVEPVHTVPGIAPVALRNSASGVGLTERAAFAGCVGEAIEYLSQCADGREALIHARPQDPSLGIDPGSAGALSAFLPPAAIAWAHAVRLSDGALAAMPADLCLRGRGEAADFSAPFPLSIGCAAGPSREAAVLHGLLECIERDAACLWWRGGIRGRALPADGDATSEATRLLAQMRPPAPRRRTWLLDISTGFGVPCCAAISSDANGRDLACGLAARMSAPAAVRAALLELMLMELAIPLAEAKLEARGEAALNAPDRAHLARRTLPPADAMPLLHPDPDPATNHEPDGVTTAETGLAELGLRLAARGVEAYVVDLTRAAYGVPVVQIICPALEKLPGTWSGDRLRRAIARTGGGCELALM